MHHRLNLTPPRPPQIECLCRIALTVYGQKVAADCQGGQTGLCNRTFGPDAPRPAEILDDAAQDKFFNKQAASMLWGKNKVVKLSAPNVAFGTIPNNTSTRDWIREHPEYWKPSMPGSDPAKHRKQAGARSILHVKL